MRDTWNYFSLEGGGRVSVFYQPVTHMDNLGYFRVGGCRKWGKRESK